MADTLAQLDALDRGQAAKRLIESDDDFGRKVFASDWRSDRSASAPLSALIEWMRSLKGLGDEPRRGAANNPDREMIASCMERTAKRLVEAAAVVKALWN
ncbi:MAG TPA: hypothetical protein VIF40_03295 [Methylosinus sp.]|uniref:hypothetical protein n=1 Tax=Methylosinus sp. TaxID=427 RepID=UPI002F94E11F